MNVKLSIDTSKNTQITVGLTINGKEDLITRSIDHRKSQAVLPLIDELLQKHRMKLSDTTAILVNPGPGSFTGLRVGITIATTLGFLLHVPVNGKKAGTLVEAKYTP